MEVALQARARGMTPSIAILTDGRANIALDGSADRTQAGDDATRMARLLRAQNTPAIVIDTGKRPAEVLRDLAQVLDAPYIPLPRADARKLSAVVGAALDA
jgi:magnesium chelatase subunit D